MYVYIYSRTRLVRILGKESLVRIPAYRPGIPWTVQGICILSRRPGIDSICPGIFSWQHKILIFPKLLL